MLAIKRVTTEQELAAAVSIQLTVFFEEQGIPEADCHEGNDVAHHVLACDGEKPVATARLICEQDGEGEVARVAVLASHRKMGIGRELVIALEKIAVSEGLHRITLHPHRYLEKFYAALGYRRTNEPAHVVGDHELVTMDKSI